MPAGTQYTLCVYDEENHKVTDSVAHVFSASGTYTVEYLFEVFGAVQPVRLQCTFLLTLEAVTPDITVNGSYENSYYAGKNLALLSATASDGVAEYPVHTEVYRNGAAIAITENAVVLQTGTYEIVYFVSYGEGKRAEVRRSFTVTADTEIPEIIVDGLYAAEYAAGNIIGVLSATVSDNSGENLTYSVEILRGKEVIEPVDGEIRLEKAGEYKIVYRATDLAGNTAEKSFEFKVTGSGCACSGEIIGSVWPGLLLIPAAAVWMTIRRRRDENEN